MAGRYTTITLNDHDYKLIYTFYSFSLVQELTGCSIDALSDASNPVKALIALLYAGLHQEHPELTFEQVGQTITPTNVDYVQEKIEEAMAKAQGVTPGGATEKKSVRRAKAAPSRKKKTAARKVTA